MDEFKNILLGLYRFTVSQMKLLFSIVSLKLRLIGFSNKRDSLHMKLGELVATSFDDIESIKESDEIVSLYREIVLTSGEIGSASHSIEQQKRVAREERAHYFDKQEKQDKKEDDTERSEKLKHNDGGD